MDLPDLDLLYPGPLADAGWFWKLTTKDQDAVMYWLSGHGVNPDWCFQFIFDEDGHVHARMYAIDSQGHAEVRDGEVQWGEDIVFTPRYLPTPVVELLQNKV